MAIVALCLSIKGLCQLPLAAIESNLVCEGRPIPEVNFDALDSAIAGKRIVFLGEQTHGDGSTLESKNQIIRHLHEKWDFDVLLLENGIYETDRAFQDFLEGRDSLVGTFCWLTMFYSHMISRPDSALAKYLEAQANAQDTLILGGVDIPQLSIYGNAFLLEWDSLMLRLSSAPGFPQAYEAFVKVVRKGKVRFYDSRKTYEEAHSPENFVAIKENAKLVCDFIQENLKLLPDHEEIVRAEFMIQAIAAKVGWWDQEANSPPLKHVKGQITFDYFQIRDQYMAQNLLWFAQKKYPDKKIIVSTSTYHCSRNINEIVGKSQRLSIETRPMLDLVWDAIGKESLNIAFLRYEGTAGISTAWMEPIKAAKKGSVEWELQKTGKDYCFFPVTKEFDDKYMFPTWEKPLRANWSNMYDLVFFISKMNPVKITAFGKRVNLDQPYKLGGEWYAPGVKYNR